jgi:hypothetical protein
MGGVRDMLGLLVEERDGRLDGVFVRVTVPVRLTLTERLVVLEAVGDAVPELVCVSEAVKEYVGETVCVIDTDGDGEEDLDGR